jgi:hypothetical protein
VSYNVGQLRKFFLFFEKKDGEGDNWVLRLKMESGENEKREACTSLCKVMSINILVCNLSY